MNTNQFGGKPLKRLWRYFCAAHRAKALAKAPVLMRVMCLALACAPALKAAEGGGNGTNALTVEALVAETLANNPELNFYKAEVAAAKGERQGAGLWANPEAAGTAGSKRASGGGVSGEGLAWSVSVKQTFEWPGRISLRKAIANKQIHLAELGYKQFRAALEARARALALSVYAAQEKAAAAREVAGRYHDLREVLVQREPAGLTPVLETRIIEATEVGLQRKASEAALAEEAAILELNQLRGQPPNTKVRIEVPILEFPVAPETEALLAAARTNNFDLRIRQAELEQQGFKVQLAKNERYPAFTVEPYFSRERALDQETQAGVGVSVPLPLWNRNEGKVDESRLQHPLGTANRDAFQRNARRDEG